MSRSITLSRQAQQPATGYGREGYRWAVSVTTSSGVAREIFRFLRRPLDPSKPTDTQVDVFSGVCRPEEMASLPVGAPHEGDDPAWLRSSSVDLVFASEELADLAWSRLQVDVRSLLLALNKMDTLTPATTTTITA